MFKAHNERHGESLAGATGRLFGIASIPHSLANNSEWWKFLHYVRSLPASDFRETRSAAVKSGQSLVAEKMTEEIYKRLNGKNVTVAIDGWTDVNSIKVIMLLCYMVALHIMWMVNLFQTKKIQQSKFINN